MRVGLLQQDATELNIGFIKRMATGLPWVRCKVAASIDGRTGLANGESKWITGDEARRDGHRWRARACAVLTGSGTVRQDNPQMTVRGVSTPLPLRQPLRVVFDHLGELSPLAKVLQGRRAGLLFGPRCRRFAGQRGSGAAARSGASRQDRPCGDHAGSRYPRHQRAARQRRAHA